MSGERLESIRRRVESSNELIGFQKSLGLSQTERDRADLLRLVDAFLRRSVIEQTPERFVPKIGEWVFYPTREAAEAVVLESVVTNG